MNKLLSVFFFFLIVSVASGQTTGTAQHSDSGADNYLGYYRAVAIAEEAVINGHFRDAVQQYKKVFAAYPYNNPIDCYIAAQVSSYTADTLSCIGFLRMGICYGLPPRTIAGNPHLAACFRKMDRSTVDSCWSIYQKRIDTRARAVMLSLIKYDQSVIQHLPDGESIYESDGYTLKGKYRPVWDSLITEIIALTRSSGFPAQKIIGTQNGEDSLFQTGPNAVFASVIFIHHGRAWNQVSEMLWAELLKGNITPQMYGVIYEYSNGGDFYSNPVHYFAARHCQEKQCKKLVREKLKEINSARWTIGLGSYEVMQKKFESTFQYYKWQRKGTRTNEPVFDFQCDLSFQRIH
jgi:hypothetical protein